MSHVAELGERIRQARTAFGTTQAELAAALGLARSSIANIEAGRQPISTENLVHLGDVLETDHRWLLTGRGLVPEHVRRPPADRKAIQRAADQLMVMAADIAADLHELAGSEVWPVSSASPRGRVVHLARPPARQPTEAT